MIEEHIAETLMHDGPYYFHDRDDFELAANAVLAALRDLLAGPDGPEVARELGMECVPVYDGGVRTEAPMFRLPKETQ